MDLGFGALGWFGGCSRAGAYGGVCKFWFGHGFGVCSDQVLDMGPQKVEKFEWCVPNRLRTGSWDILSDEWQKLRDEWWVMKKKSKQGLSILKRKYNKGLLDIHHCKFPYMCVKKYLVF